MAWSPGCGLEPRLRPGAPAAARSPGCGPEPRLWPGARSSRLRSSRLQPVTVCHSSSASCSVPRAVTAPLYCGFVSSLVAGETHSGDFTSNGHSQRGGGTPETGGVQQPAYGDEAPSAGSQLEHQTSVKAEQFYDHAFFSTMLLYHGS